MIPKGHDKTEWKPITFNSITVGVYRKVGNVVEININCWTGNGFQLDGFTDNVIGNLPDEFKPEKDYSIPIYCRTTEGIFPKEIRLDIKTNGAITLFNWGNTVIIEGIYAYMNFIV